VEKWLIKASSRNFVFYTILAFFLAFFLVVLIKKWSKINNREIAILLMSMGFIFFLLFSRPVFLFQLIVLEMFMLGIFIALEGRKSKSILCFILIAVAAVLVEISSNISIGSSFYYLDAWRNSLIALSGYLTGSLLQ
jgi:hypothetical protein